MVGLKGLRGQRMSGRRRPLPKLRRHDIISGAGSGDITAPLDISTIAELWLWGAGGGAELSTQDWGGAGGGALYKRFACARGARIAYSIGAGGVPGGDGNASFVTLPDGRVLRAGGGQGSLNAAAAGPVPSAGGVSFGGDVNRTGGKGGVDKSAGEAPLFGGDGGTPSGSASGGGGSAGFRDLGEIALGGNGGSAGNGSGKLPGGGGGGGGNTTGGAGKLVVVFSRVQET
jgi:hypothetical protein